MARQSKKTNKRVTPKGTRPTDPGNSQSSTAEELKSLDESSHAIVPVIMFASLTIGTLMILVNYLVEVESLKLPSYGYLFGGLGLILVGIITATQYK